jgi:hypothetical protein
MTQTRRVSIRVTRSMQAARIDLAGSRLDRLDKVQMPAEDCSKWMGVSRYGRAAGW